MKHLLLFYLAFVMTACSLLSSDTARTPVVVPEGMAVATFAGGCFWCTEHDLQKITGVQEVISGYAGGTDVDPTYEQVAGKQTDHREAVQVIYDPNVVSYDILLDAFWRHIDPTDEGGQFVDRGPQYSTAIWYHTDQQRDFAERSKQSLDQSGVFGEPIVTPILPFTTFYPAEGYHQNYAEENPIRYQFYREGSGRDRFITSVWGDE